MEDIIIADLKDNYGLICNEITAVSGGWLNQKWKVGTEKYNVLVKKFSPKRFNRKKLKLIEAALQRQIILHKNGVLCPYILQSKGRAIRHLNNNISYTVMEFHKGKVEDPDTITLNQMQSLGSTCGLMHKIFSRLPVLSVKGYPLNDRQLIDNLWDNFYASKKECLSDATTEYRQAVLAQESILNQLKNDFFDKMPKGIAHEDFTSDNILFDIDCVSAIIDFDRNQYSYIWHDIGRAILSFALRDNKIDTEKINSFREGYSRYTRLSMSNIVDALRLTWCIEVPWWIQEKYFLEERGKAIRFRDEILWLTEHWFELDSILCP